MLYPVWELNQVNLITFVMINAGGVEVPGLGGAFTLQISKNGGAFVPSAGVKAEISNGWYTYTATALEADTLGTISIRVTGAGCIQQNLEYVVKERTVNSIDFTYTLTDSVTTLPIEGAEVWFTTDVGGLNIVWKGFTDTFGVARDENGFLPDLDVGVYFVWRQRTGYTFVDPDIETVS